MSATQLSTNNFALASADRFYDAITENKDLFYVFVGDFITHANSDLQPLYDITSNNFTGVMNNMILGKRVATTDVARVIEYVPWTTSTVYATYDDIDSNLPSKQFFVVTNEGSYYHIWLCLENNLNGLSTIQPLFAAGASTPSYRTSDGYLWKYLASVDTATSSKFKVDTTFFPIVANTSVANSAVPGSILSFKIESGGTFYNNYISGTFAASDIYISGRRSLLNISTAGVNQTNGYYANCIILMTSGACQGQYRNINSYSVSFLGNVIEIDTLFTGTIQNGDTYEITPKVCVIGDGAQAVNCVARALVNASSTNSIYRIEVLEPGESYRWATANVTFNPAALSISNTAIVRPILPPPGGHGANVFSQLYCSNIVISTSFANTEANTIPDTNQFQQIGLIRNPLFANVQATLAAQKGNFLPGETVMQFISHRINNGATIVQGNTVLSCNTADFLTQVNVGDYLYVTSNAYSPSELVKVQSIGGNSSWVNLTSNSIFSSSNAFVYTIESIATYYLSNVSANTLSLSNTNAFLANTASLLIGLTSGATGSIGSFQISGVAKQYNTFINLYKYIATSTGGQFIQGEKIQQGNSAGYLYSVEGTGTLTMYCSGNPFTVNNQILGATSEATATISAVYPPEIVFGSGEIDYVENISPVVRQNNQTETIQLVVNF